MTTYHIEPSAETLQNCFACEIPPVLTIADGDTVIFKTLDSAWGLEPMTQENTATRRQFPQPTAPYDGWGHAVCGPVAINGASLGMTLEIRIGKIIPGSYGWTQAGGKSRKVDRALGLNDSLSRIHSWQLDNDTGIAQNQFGHRVKMRPFMGVLGVAPPEPGPHSTRPPRIWGGNLDCKELVTGTSLFLPIGVDGALFSVGDGHATQADGEVSTYGVECPMEHVELSFHLHDFAIKTARARLENAWITFGFHEDLEQATFQALDSMLDMMIERYGGDRKDALALASLVVDIRVTQIANETLGVHAVLPDNALV